MRFCRLAENLPHSTQYPTKICGNYDIYTTSPEHVCNRACELSSALGVLGSTCTVA